MKTAARRGETGSRCIDKERSGEWLVPLPNRLAEIDVVGIGQGTRGRARRAADQRTGDRMADQRAAQAASPTPIASMDAIDIIFIARIWTLLIAVPVCGVP